MFDDQERAAFGQAADQRDRALGFGAAHARGRLVQQDDVGAAGHRDADLERPLLGIGQKARGHVAPGGQVDVGEDLRGALAHLGQVVDVLPEGVALAGRPQHGAAQVLPYAHVGEDVGDLEAARQAAAVDLDRAAARKSPRRAAACSPEVGAI